MSCSSPSQSEGQSNGPSAPSSFTVFLRSTRPVAALERICTRYLPVGSLRRSLFTGAFWSLGGSVLSRGCALLTSIILARLLGKMGFGQWGLVVSTVSLFAQFAIFGVALTATKHVAELRRTDPERAGRVLSLALLVGLISVSVTCLLCVAAAGWLAQDLFQVPELTTPIRLASLMLFGMVGLLMVEGALAGFEDFRRIARVRAVQGLVLVVGAPLLTWRLGITGAVLAMAASQWTAMILSLRITVQNCRRHDMRLRVRGVWQEREVLWQYAVPSLLGGAASAPAVTLSKALVARLPGGVVGLGGFEAAYRWRDVVLFIPGAVRLVTLPMLSRLKGQNNYRRYVRALWANMGLNAGIALAGALPIMALSPWILALYGKEFREDWDMMVILVGSGIFQSAKDVLARVTSSMGKIWWQVWMSVVWGAATLGGTYYLLPIYGVRGYVWTVAGASVLGLLMYAVAAAIILRRWRSTEAEGA